MLETNKNALNTRDIGHKVATSEAFIRAANQDGTLQLSERDRRRKAIGVAASALTGETKSGYMSTEGHAMNVTAKLTYFRDSLDKLHHLRAVGSRHHEKLPALRKIAEFNHAVKDMVNSNPSLGFAEVLSFILKMDQNINGRNTGGHEFETEVRGVLIGMRHEIAFEQILGYIPEAEYKETTVEDDLNGADILISLDNSPLTAIDIKASYETTQRSKNEATWYGFDSSHIVWSHINEEDFNGTFRISNETAKLKSTAVYDDLCTVIFPKPNPTLRTA